MNCIFVKGHDLGTNVMKVPVESGFFTHRSTMFSGKMLRHLHLFGVIHNSTYIVTSHMCDIFGRLV